MPDAQPPGRDDRAVAEPDDDSATEYDIGTPGDPTERTPGYTERVRRIVAAVLARTPWSGRPSSVQFGWDSIDTIADAGGAWGFDSIDWLNDADKAPLHCKGCGRVESGC